MNHTLKLPGPLIAEINGYAARIASSPQAVIQSAWMEFLQRHPGRLMETSNRSSVDALLEKVEMLRGSITLPGDQSDKDLIAAARLEKHGTP